MNPQTAEEFARSQGPTLGISEYQGSVPQEQVFRIMEAYANYKEKTK